MTAAEMIDAWTNGTPTPLRQLFKDAHTAVSAQVVLDYLISVQNDARDSESQLMLDHVVTELPTLIAEY